MNNGLQQAGTATFFPTAKEVASGLQWVKEHPMLAAAAATAVSVITYLSTAEGAPEGIHGDDCAPENDNREAMAMAPSMASPRRRGLQSDDGKHSPAAVSWCDEHGGSLTQVYEASEDGAVYSRGRHESDHSKPKIYVPRQNETEKDAAIVPSKCGEVHRDERPTVGDMEFQTESPQWGWYVAITPPQDHTQGQLPRAVAQSMRGAAVHNASAANSVGSSLRRSTSGRLP